jgi:hypothetical protein
MGCARIRVSFPFLRELLCLPVLTEIRHASMSSDGYCDDVELIVSHPDLVDVPRSDGELPPLITPTFRKQEPVVFISWNQ